MEYQPNPSSAPDQSDEADFELLGAYLDGELTAGERGRLDRRLADEPDLAAALSRMSAEAVVRRAVWGTAVPTANEGDAVADGVARAARRWELRRRFARAGRVAGAAAACLAVGFLVGWVGRGTTAAQAHGGQPPSNGHATQAPAPPADSAFVYQVALTDEAGNITAVQKFDSLDAARNFAADVGRWQARQMAAQPGQPEAPAVTSTGL